MRVGIKVSLGQADHCKLTSLISRALKEVREQGAHTPGASQAGGMSQVLSSSV